MPVGSEWWGAEFREATGTKGAEAASPMPVGSEWWGAKIWTKNNKTNKYHVANACRQ